MVEEVLLNMVRRMDRRTQPITARLSLLPSGTIKVASLSRSDVLARPAASTNILANRIAVLLAKPPQAWEEGKTPVASRTTITVIATAG